MGWAAGNVRVSLGELLAVLSLGIDLGLGQPIEHMLRQCVLAVELSGRLDLDPSECEVVQYVGLIAWMGCHSNSHEQAKWFGDDIAFRADSYQVDWTPMALARYSMGKIGAGAPAPRRARTVAAFMRSGRKQVDPSRAIHCSA